MSDPIEDLQIRFTEQEDALQTLTRTVLEQARELDRLRAEVDELRTTVREIGRGGFAAPGSEPPPPHY